MNKSEKILYERLQKIEKKLRTALKYYAVHAKRMSWDELDDKGNLIRTITIQDGTAVAREALGWVETEK